MHPLIAQNLHIQEDSDQQQQRQQHQAVAEEHTRNQATAVGGQDLAEHSSQMRDLSSSAVESDEAAIASMMNAPLAAEAEADSAAGSQHHHPHPHQEDSSLGVAGVLKSPSSMENRGNGNGNGPLPANGGAGVGGDADGHVHDAASTMYDPMAMASTFKRQNNNRDKPNKIYVGNLPNQTRDEDLEGCFSELGKIASVELKIGYGFVEFETREDAERAVQKYDGGLFLGNKIRCELSHGSGKVSKFSGEPGICFKCRLPGHWARECPNPPVDPNWVDHHKGDRRPNRHHGESRGKRHDELAPYPMRSPSGYRDDPRDAPPGAGRLPPPPMHHRDYRYDDLSAGGPRDSYRPPPRSDHGGRPMSPPSRAYSRDYDDMRGGVPPPPMLRPPPVAAAYDARGMPPDPRGGYDVRGGSAPYEPVSRPPYAGGYQDYDRPAPPLSRDYPPPAPGPLSASAYDRGGAPPYGAVAAPYMGGRPRSPLPYDTRRDLNGSTAAAYDPYRGRGYPPAGPPGGPAPGAPPSRYDPYSRRRSMSPPARSLSYGGYDAGPPPPMPPSGYGGGSGGGGGPPPYRPQDYPAPPSNGYYEPPGSMYRGGPPPPGGAGGAGRDERGDAGGDRRFPPPENGRMGPYDRR
ncbi:hypothetical protein FRB97_000418 [Tulasnella sp. 331]|nr:hypothetical protein FRB97_000418 [Tulasnella sp. 331]KAG8889974.1 hypothetical protein FRB98_001709 [Tulasnella sp. 332]